MSQLPVYASRPHGNQTHAYGPHHPQPSQPTPLPTKRQQSRPRRRSRRSPQRLGWLISGLALATLATVPQDQLSRWLAPLAAPHTSQQSVFPWSLGQSHPKSVTCQQMVNKEQRLSREQLTQFIPLSQGTAQEIVHDTIAPPYCALSKSQQSQQQEAYPLAFDPETWFVVNYAQGNYTGYDFVFKR
ncbi:MAG: hypothetical protein AAFY17_05370 [Cyanobacteria bacterium J06642_11]